MDNKKNSSTNKTTSSTSKKQPKNSQVDSRTKDFISSAINPDNNAFFDERSNHLGSKGD
ncbi:hypothetical protein [Anaerosporobacter sp.]|uniref:hypothetical protein n=1 Tax=Anaerosporobacter sp. TaxID=1872529 RepID=UPI00286F6843|nr:hypothetical protein [Anaerosporobacter sp.]